MALWQVDFYVLPKIEWELNLKTNFLLIDNFDDSFFWLEKTVHPNFFKDVQLILPVYEKAWCSYLTIYGHEVGTRLDVECEAAKVESVILRIDFTTYYAHILKQLIQFFISNELILVDEKLNRLQLNFETINSSILNSPRAIRYNSLQGK